MGCFGSRPVVRSQSGIYPVLRVLHVTNAFPTDQSPDYGVFIKEQVASLETLVDKNDVFFINAREKGASEYVKLIGKLRSVLRENNYDIIHCHHIFSFYVVLLTFCSKRFKIVISFLNQPENEIKLGVPLIFKMAFYRLAHRLSDKVILKHSLSNEQLLDHKIIQLPNGVDVTRFYLSDCENAKKKLGLDLNKNYILFVSSKNPERKQKRRDLFVKMIKALQADFPDGNFSPLEISGIQRDYVVFYFNAACCHLLTSDYEGSPNSVKESLACGTPVVSRAVGNVVEMISDSDYCHVFDENDFKSAVNFIGTNYPLSGLQRKNVRAILDDKKLDMGNTAIKLYDIYRKL